MSILFTKKQFEELEKRILRAQKKLDKTLKRKGEVAGSSAGDGWHSAEFMATYVEEMELRKRLADLKRLASNAKLVEPKKQNEKVDIGNRVVIEYEDGSQERLIMEGYIMTEAKNRVSIYSPMGKALKGTKKGRVKTVTIHGQKQKIKILEILPPSKT